MDEKFEFNDEAWQYATDTANSRALANLSEKEQAGFVPLSLSEYKHFIISQLNESYETARINGLANDPTIKGRFLKLLAQPKNIRDIFAAQVDNL